MPASNKNIIAIVGATGRQGGSVARTFLSAPQSSRWQVHCLTRNPASEAAKYLYQHTIPPFIRMPDAAVEVHPLTFDFEHPLRRLDMFEC
jgi:hypothetical protein